MVITKNNVAHETFRESIWANRGWEDIDSRKTQLAQSVWEEQFRDRVCFLNILFFQRYFPRFCNSRLARYKKVYKADIPEVISSALLKSGEMEIQSDDAEIVYAVDVVSPCSLKNFLDSCALLHKSNNLHLVTVSGKQNHILPQYWDDIYAATREIGPCINDRSIVKILAALPDDVRMLWTGGFFDDADICLSVITKI